MYARPSFISKYIFLIIAAVMIVVFVVLAGLDLKAAQDMPTKPTPSIDRILDHYASYMTQVGTIMAYHDINNRTSAPDVKMNAKMHLLKAQTECVLSVNQYHKLLHGLSDSKLFTAYKLPAKLEITKCDL